MSAGVTSGLGVVPAGTVAPAPTWRRRVVQATRLSMAAPRLWPVALAGFLARGGILVLLLGIVPFPSAVGLANLIGPTAITAAGLTAGAILLLVGAGVALIVVVVAVTGVGAATDVVLATAFEPPCSGGTFVAAPDPPGTLRRLTAIRLLSDLVLLVAIAIAARPVFDAVYAELTAPTDVATPLVLRAIRDAAGPIGLVVVAWLVVEVVGGIAVRIAVLRPAGVWRSLRLAAGHVVRHPLPTLATTALDAAALIGLVVPLLACAAAWSLLRGLVEDRAGPVAILGAMILLAAAWIGTFLLAAISSTWRGLLWTAEVRRTGD